MILLRLLRGEEKLRWSALVFFRKMETRTLVMTGVCKTPLAVLDTERGWCLVLLGEPWQWTKLESLRRAKHHPAGAEVQSY